jgi:hypothetical protein
MVPWRLIRELWRLTIEILHHFDEEPDLDPHQSKKLRVVEAYMWSHGS